MKTLLIIDDSFSQRAEIRAALEPTDLFEQILEADDGLAGLKILLSESVDMVLCDLEMPGMDGEKLLHVKESRAGGHEIPFMFLTAITDWERKARLLDAGACDSITKPFHPSELIARVQLHLKIKNLQDELREKNETLSRVSSTDSVTELRTRRYASEILAIECLRAHRYKVPLTVLMADIDYFKKVNDTYGHAAGDTVLLGTAEMLRENLRATDVAGRWGGEEFLVIMPETEVAGGKIFADRWRADLEAASFDAGGGKEVKVTISIGVAGFQKEHTSPEDLVATADEALYQAKHEGRNRVIVHESSL